MIRLGPLPWIPTREHDRHCECRERGFKRCFCRIRVEGIQLRLLRLAVVQSRTQAALSRMTGVTRRERRDAVVVC